MPRLNKHKQHLVKIAPLVMKSNKRRRTIKHFKLDAAFQIQQRQDDDFWDKYEYDLENDFSSDESGSEEELKENEEGKDDKNQRDKKDTGK